MAIKVYNRKGNISLKEKAMVREIEKAILLRKTEATPLEITPANNIVELEELYNTYVITDAEIVSMDNTETQSTPLKESILDKKNKSDVTEKFVDPFNRDTPIVRDYVLSEEFEEPKTEPTKTTFDEPLSFDESFTIPDSASQNTKQNEAKGTLEPEKIEIKQDTINPAFNEMDTAKQRKKTKRFAKAIVSLTCDLLEKGFEWYTMQNITEAKLTEYEINNEMDLTILLEMPNGEQDTVKSFFLSQHDVIRQEAKIEQEDREDLIEALTEVFIEKGITPTPTQELMLVAARVVGLQTLKATAIVNSNNSVIAQLKAMKKEEISYDDYTGENQQTPEPANKVEKKQPEFDLTKEPSISFDQAMFPTEITKE